MRVGSGDTKHTAVSPHARAQAITIFGERCAVCHGIDGGGEGPASSNLNPKPPNFHDRKWQRSVSDERMAKAIVDGGASVGLSEAMASNPDLQGRPDVVAALVEKLAHVGRANLQFQRGGHTVHRLQAVACGGLVVLVEINEAGSDDEAGRVNDSRSSQRPLADGGDLVAANTHVADSVQRGLGVDDASAVDHQVITGLAEGCAADHQSKKRNPH